MMKGDVDAIIAGCFLLRGLRVADRQRLIENGRFRRVSQEEFFFQQGEEANKLYILIEGRTKLTQVNPEGNQVIMNYFGPGDPLGVIVALSEMPYPVSAEAIEECHAIYWQRDVIIELMRAIPQLALNGIEMIGRRFAWLQDRFQEMATQRVEQRVARAVIRLIRQFGERTEEGVLLNMPLTREDLAQMTGTNLYSVSRILSKWEQAGIIKSKRSHIILDKAHALVAIAEDLPSGHH